MTSFSIPFTFLLPFFHSGSQLFTIPSPPSVSALIGSTLKKQVQRVSTREEKEIAKVKKGLKTEKLRKKVMKVLSVFE